MDYFERESQQDQSAEQAESLSNHDPLIVALDDPARPEARTTVRAARPRSDDCAVRSRASPRRGCTVLPRQDSRWVVREAAPPSGHRELHALRTGYTEGVTPANAPLRMDFHPINHGSPRALGRKER